MGEDMIKGVNEWRKYKYKNLLQSGTYIIQ